MADLLTAPQEDVAAGSTSLRPAIRLSLRANIAWTLAGNVVYAGCQWAMLVVLAKLGTTSMVGQFGLALALTAPILLFTNLQLRQVQATDARHQYAFDEYLGLRLVMSLLALLVIIALVLVGGYTGETAGIILMVGLAKTFEFISDVFYGLLQQRERMDRIAISMMVKGTLSLVALGLGVAITGSVFWGAVGLATAWAIVLASYDIRVATSVLRNSIQAQQHGTSLSPESANTIALRASWHPTRLLRLAWLSLPLGVAMLLISLNTNIPRYFIEYFRTESDLGIFTAITYLMVAGTTVISAVGQAASPRLAFYHAGSDSRAFRSLTGKLLALSIIIGATGVLVAIIAGREVLTILYSPEYGARADVFVWVMLGAGLWYITSVLGYAATARRRIGYQPIALVAIVLASIISCYALIPAYGLWGAAISTTISSSVGVLAYALLLV